MAKSHGKRKMARQDSIGGLFADKGGKTAVEEAPAAVAETAEGAADAPVPAPADSAAPSDAEKAEIDALFGDGGDAPTDTANDGETKPTADDSWTGADEAETSAPSSSTLQDGENAPDAPPADRAETAQDAPAPSDGESTVQTPPDAPDAATAQENGVPDAPPPPPPAPDAEKPAPTDAEAPAEAPSAPVQQDAEAPSAPVAPVAPAAVPTDASGIFGNYECAFDSKHAPKTMP